MDLTQIRTGLAAHGTPTRGRRYPPELRAGIRAHICTARASGKSWASLSATSDCASILCSAGPSRRLQSPRWCPSSRRGPARRCASAPHPAPSSKASTSTPPCACCGRSDDWLVARLQGLGLSSAGRPAQLCGGHRYALYPLKWLFQLTLSGWCWA